MAILKNVAGQKIGVFVYTSSTGAAKTGDAANITAYLSKDGAAPAPLADTNPAELDSVNAPGWYIFDLAQAETNAEVMIVAPKSATAGVLTEQIQVITQDAAISSRASSADLATVDGIVDAILVDTSITIPAQIAALSPTVFPAGAIEFTYTVTDSVSGDPLDGVDIWISTDLAGTSVIWRGTTDAFGIARDVLGNKPMLDAGTVYIWRQLALHLFTNPDVEVVS